MAELDAAVVTPVETTVTAGSVAVIQLPRELSPGAVGTEHDRISRIARVMADGAAATVTLLDAQRRCVPGGGDLAPGVPLEEAVATSHALCEHVAISREPLVVADRRVAQPPLDLAAAPFWNACAAFPLLAPDGRAIGALTVLADHTRGWSREQLDVLAELAAVCSGRALDLSSRQSAATAAQAAQGVSRRATVLLALSQALARTQTGSDIAAALQDVAGQTLGCHHAGTWLLSGSGQELHHVGHPAAAWPQAESHPAFAVDSGNPLGRSLLEARPSFFRDRADQDRHFPDLAAARRAPVDGGARAIVPLHLGKEPLGVLVLVWPGQREFSDDDRVTIAALSSYTAQAVSRARLHDERSSAARTLQAALLSDLPRHDQLRFTARYRTATAMDDVGGDWYDAVVLPSGSTWVTIGDVAGHDISAAAAMGGLRSMLRTLTWVADGPPSGILTQLDRAAGDLGLDRAATLALGRLDAAPGSRPGSMRFSWSNAGHPAPLVLAPDGRCHSLDGRSVDVMLGVDATLERHDHSVDMAPGSILLMFTDGLVETRHDDLEAGRRRLVDAVSRFHGGDLGTMLDAVLDELVGAEPDDDVCVLAVELVTTITSPAA